ncbi:MAG: hypothetical protein KA144_01800, partial [Xanthomonadaceae bacterium]|nr:hypothetical protein [Xanthomonadaceae bacterium]
DRQQFGVGQGIWAAPQQFLAGAFGFGPISDVHTGASWSWWAGWRRTRIDDIPPRGADLRRRATAHHRVSCRLISLSDISDP